MPERKRFFFIEVFPNGAFQSFSLSMLTHFGNNTPQVHQSMKKYSSSQMAHLPLAASQNSTEEIMVEFASMPPGTIMTIMMIIVVMDSWRSRRSWRLSWSTLSQHTWHDHSRTTVDTNLILMRMWIHQKRIQICVSNKNHLQAGVLAASLIETMKCEPPGFTCCRL